MAGFAARWSERDQEVGCWILSNDPIGELSERPVFWHLDSFATREAAEAAKGRRGTVLQALGKVWLLTIEGANWHASGGQHISTIGPLPITPGAYAVQYMEAVFTPGMTAPTHTHSGPEAWYTVAGETMPRNTHGIRTRLGWWPSGHCAGWPTDASDRNGHRDTPCSGSDPARREQTSYDFAPRLEAKRPLQEVSRAPHHSS